MPFNRGPILRILPALVFICASLAVSAQGGNAGAVHGTVTDPSGAVIPGATVHLTNGSAAWIEPLTTDATGQFVFANIPFNPYRITVLANGFAPLSQSFEIRSVGGNQPQAGSCRWPAAARPSPLKPQAIWSRPIPPSTPTWTATCSSRCRWRAQSSIAQFAGHAVHARRGGRLQRPLSRPGRPCFELVFSGRPVDHRPAEQGLLQPDSVELDSIDRSDQRRAAGRIWRQDQPGDCGHHALRAGRYQADRQHQQLPMARLARRPADSTCPMAARSGATSSRPTASTPAAFSIRRSSRSSTTRATSRTSSTAWTTASRRPIRSTWI